MIDDFLDPSTGVFHEAAFRHLLARETGRATRYQDYFSLCLVKPDIPDGSEASLDEIEAAVSSKIPQFIRSTDLVGRMAPGIGIVLLHTAGPDAVRVAERIRGDMEQVVFHDRPAGRPRRVTLSIGEVSFPRHGHSRDALLSRVEQCLRQAAERGGNQVVYAEETAE